MLTERNQNIIKQINEFGHNRTPFLFIIDFEEKFPKVYNLDKIDNSKIKFSFNGKTNFKPEKINKTPIIKAFPPSFDEYKKSFNIVKKNILHGNSYLTNLTFKSKIESNLSLEEIFHISKAKYKLWFNNEFTFFSPEIFVQIKNNKILSYPMKGTIDANLPNAKKKLLSDEKETAEHYTIVDLIRNDLNIIAKNVKVDKFRYIDRIKSTHKELLQMSSQISGILPANYNQKLGEIIFSLLPAGSISGAPKKKTLEIISNAETYKRGYYTGIAGIFDGKNLDSCVMIRFIEKQNEKLFYKSGGGITSQSIAEKEYQEMIDKIYIPI
ncbi:MAG: aminodeoxychorismate synthase component I [Bacteroidales bacterium]|nr:aminodeoxychorismate synthase component I [Bacteroidales bacterium]